MVVEYVGTFFQNLQSYGFYDYLLPFLLIFTIIFAMLEKTKIMGTENGKPRTNIDTLLAVIIAFIVVVQTEIVMIMNNYLSKMALLIIIVLIFLLLLGVFGADVSQGLSGWLLGLGFLISVVGVIWALSPDIGLGNWLSQYYLFTEPDKAFLIMLLVIGGVIFFVTRNPSPRQPRAPNALTALGDLLRGGGNNNP